MQKTLANDQEALKQLFQAMSAAWNNSDGEAFGKCFTNNCDYVTFNGQHLKGRKEIAEVHQELFDGVLRGSKMNHRVKDIRYLSPNLAIVHVVGAVKLRWQKNAPKGRESINTNVSIKENGEWKITAFHNCRIKEPKGFVKWLMNRQKNR